MFTDSTIDLLSPVDGRYVAALIALVLMCFLLVRLTAGPASHLARRWGLLAIRSTLVVILLALLLNPVRVTRLPGTGDSPEVFYLLDASASMQMGDQQSTRWNDAVGTMRDAAKATEDRSPAKLRLFRFGRRLAAVDDSLARQLVSGARQDDAREAGAAEPPPSANGTSRAEVKRPGQIDPPALGPNDPDTQLLVALRQISSRFGRSPPVSIVVFSDGRARNESGVPEIANHFRKLRVPIHVVPLGHTQRRGDISVVAVVAPERVRKQSQVTVHAFLRSYGFDGVRAEIRLSALDPQGNVVRTLDKTPLVLQSGFQPVSLRFRSDLQTRRLQVSVPAQPHETSTENNRFETEIAVDRTKIQVLYLEGNRSRLRPTQRYRSLGSRPVISDFHQALIDDTDIECAIATQASGILMGLSEQTHMFPKVPADLFAFDVMVLSDISRATLSAEMIEWIATWVGQRGAGLCMTGGRGSFGSGGWDQGPMQSMLPVEGAAADWQPSARLTVTPTGLEPPHALWRFHQGESQNLAVLRSFPALVGVNAGLRPKPALATVLATNRATGATRPNKSRLATAQQVPSGDGQGRPATEGFPVIVAGQYGTGRTLAIGFPVAGPGTEQFVKWGSRGNEYYGKFWRNVIYWLSENSAIGRRRLVATADKRYYRPGDTIVLGAMAYDESAHRSGDYRVVATVEPQRIDEIDSDYSVLRWPSGAKRTSGEDGPFVAWGEEIELPVREDAEGNPRYVLQMPISDALSIGSARESLRLELTAYEGFSQVDSTSIAVQVLHDPFEQQNPFPNHELLRKLARGSGGSVLKDADSLAAMLMDLPTVTGPTVVRKTPAWSTWWLWAALVTLLTVEWCWRRTIGLA